MPETSDRSCGFKSCRGVLGGLTLLGLLGCAIVYAVRPAPNDDGPEATSSNAKPDRAADDDRIETEGRRHALAIRTEETSEPVSRESPVGAPPRWVEAPSSTPPPTDEPPPADLTETRGQFARTWASVMASPGMSEERRERLLSRLAREVFGDQADVELARAAGSDEARIELARREEAGRWLRDRFADLRADSSASAEARRTAVRRLLDEYLARIDGATENDAVP